MTDKQFVAHFNELKTGLAEIKISQAEDRVLLHSLNLNFTNHLAHHREDRLRDEDRRRKWTRFWIAVALTIIPTMLTTAYFLGKHL
ncbi:MAG: hypothetical protein ACTSPI_02320 [Candidatus Heimdallarchaeaceae archaeon]